jgi:cell division protein FtsW (lipid II flippase)
LARYLAARAPCPRFRHVLVALGIAGVPAFLIMKEPDLGTSLLLLPVLVVMLAVAGARRVDFARLALGGIALLPLLWTGMSPGQKSRVSAVLNQPGPGDRVGAEDYQLYQAKQMLALGGMWGSFWSGAPAENPAACHLPEARGDFIFPVLGERFGLAGIGLILALYAVLVVKGFAIAAATDEPYGRLTAAGLTALLATQVLVNTGMALGLLPITGVPLPLVSYGGSGMVVYGLVIGLLINIHVNSTPGRG